MAEDTAPAAPDDDPIAALERKRADRRARREAAERKQLATDLEAINDLEEQHGDASLMVLAVDYVAGSPLRVVVRTPTRPEMQRYRSRVRPKSDGSLGDTVGGAEELGRTCLVYPDAEAFEVLASARPGIVAQAGLLAVRLANGQAEETAKG